MPRTIDLLFVATIVPNFDPLWAMTTQNIEIVPPLTTKSCNILRPHSHHLVVHFDINETILVGDEAGGDTREDCLNKMISKSAFVRIPEEGAVSYEETSIVEPTHWWNGTPISADNDDKASVPPLYIGWEWPDKCCPYYRTAFKRKAKTFCDHDGRPYRPMLHKIEETLQLEESVSGLPALDHMLPAFFHTLQALVKTAQKKTIVFRTMGSDLDDVAAACNAFAQGKHPHYPDFSDESLVIDAASLVNGRWVEKSDGTTIYQLYRDDQLVAAGDKEVLEFIHSRRILGIQDDYPFWNAHGHVPWSGKPVWKLPTVQHVLFDDNIHNLKDDSIASIRRPNSHGGFECLTSQEILQEQGRHLIRVPTIAPILNPSWFIEQIDAAQQMFVVEKAD